MTTSHESQPLSEREAFENGYFYFVKALRVLSMPPDAQCEWMGDLDVAWNMRDDVWAAKYLLKSPSSQRLSHLQRDAVEALIAALDNVPVNNLPGGAGREPNLQAMRHPSWEPLRSAGAKLIEVLAPATHANDQYFESLSTR